MALFAVFKHTARLTCWNVRPDHNLSSFGAMRGKPLIAPYGPAFRQAVRL
jgi:hypothetical protein